MSPARDAAACSRRPLLRRDAEAGNPKRWGDDERRRSGRGFGTSEGGAESGANRLLAASQLLIQAPQIAGDTLGWHRCRAQCFPGRCRKGGVPDAAPPTEATASLSSTPEAFCVAQEPRRGAAPRRRRRLWMESIVCLASHLFLAARQKVPFWLSSSSRCAPHAVCAVGAGRRPLQAQPSDPEHVSSSVPDPWLVLPEGPLAASRICAAPHARQT